MAEALTKKEAFDVIVKILKPFSKNEDALKNANYNSRVLEDLQVNSARLVDLVIAFEEKLEITIDDEAAERTRTLGEISDLIVEKSKGLPPEKILELKKKIKAELGS